ncbi:MAG TPA: DUF1292 domain-containing protein [Bacillota bacterium]|nr:DUF1292 domain-containing protein [Bacillota bacterium]
MALEPKERIIIPNDGEEHLFEVLVTFTIDEYNQTYVAVTPVEQADSEEVELFAFRYEMKEDDENDIALFPIESDEEWDLVDETLQTLVDDDII